MPLENSMHCRAVQRLACILTWEKVNAFGGGTEVLGNGLSCRIRKRFLNSPACLLHPDRYVRYNATGTGQQLLSFQTEDIAFPQPRIGHDS